MSYASSPIAATSFADDSQVINSEVTLTGVSAGFTPGDPFIEGNAVFLTTGVEASTNLGQAVGEPESIYPVTGEEVVSTLGTPVTQANADVSPTGLQSDTELGTIGHVGSVVVEPTGINIQFSEGTIERVLEQSFQPGNTFAGAPFASDEIINSEAILVGINSTIALNNVDLVTDNNIQVTPPADQMDTFLGTLEAFPQSIIEPTGIGLRTGLPGNPNEYSAEGSTALSTDQAKFGVSSVEFDGTSGQGVQQNVSSGFASGDFTSEFWIYSSSIRSQSCTLWDFRISGLGLLLTNLNGQISFFKDGAGGSSPTSILTNDTWHHIAIVRTGSTGNVYVDGNLQITRTIGTDDYSSHTVLLGNNVFNSSGYLSGYIDEYRDSNIVRYSSNFTPPTSAFTVDDNTYSLLHFDGVDGSTVIVNSAAPEAIDVTGTAVITPTGAEANVETGTLTINANSLVEPSGLSMAFADGTSTVTAGATATPTGINVSTNTGTVVIESAYSLTGVSMQFVDGDPTVIANADVPVTGIEISAFVGNMRSTPWANVVTNANNTWTPVAA
jgi:hypothetical protein